MLDKLIEALFGRKTEPKTEEQPLARTYDVYYERTLRLKREIISCDEIVKNICNAFESTYLYRESSEQVVFLGRGSTHIVLNVGQVADQEQGKPIHLAVRLSYGQYEPYLDDKFRSQLLVPQLEAFETAFVSGYNPPYFVGIASWKGHEDKFDHRLLGFILEDVSERKRYKLVPDGHQFFFREEEDGKRTWFFLDPLTFGLSDSSSRYLSDEAIINVN